MRIKIVCTAIALSLSACGGGGAGDESPITSAANAISVPETVSYYAEIRQINLSADNDTNVSTMVAVFVEFPNLALTALLEKSHASEPGCEIKRQTAEEIATEQALLNAQYPLAVVSNAGENVTVTAPGGTWPALEKIGTYGAAYSADWDIELGLLPAGSTMNVPGDEFPAVNDIELPFTDALTGVEFLNESMEPLPITEAATSSLTVHWDAPAASTARMNLTLLNSEYDDTGVLESISSLICDIDDNGSFTIPTEMKQLMDPQYQLRSLTRFNSNTEKRGDTLIYAHSESRSLAVK